MYRLVEVNTFPTPTRIMELFWKMRAKLQTMTECALEVFAIIMEHPVYFFFFLLKKGSGSTK